ncbi:MAG: hypothetical protein LBN09_07275 [Clostridioides sp.]|nr:hypothetical protein [Clostridioides sp.]
MKKIFKPWLTKAVVIAVIFTTSNIELTFAQGKEIVLDANVGGYTQAIQNKSIRIETSLTKASINDEFYISIKSAGSIDKLLEDAIRIKIPNNIEYLQDKTEQENHTTMDKDKADGERGDIVFTYDNSSRELRISSKKSELSPELNADERDHFNKGENTPEINLAQQIRLVLKTTSSGPAVLNLMSNERKVISNDIKIDVVKPTSTSVGKDNNINIPSTSSIRSALGAGTKSDPRNVRTWDEFRDAYNDETVGYIKVTADINASYSDGGENLKPRTRSIDIDGFEDKSTKYNTLTVPKKFCLGMSDKEPTGVDGNIGMAAIPVSKNSSYASTGVANTFNVHDITIKTSTKVKNNAIEESEYGRSNEWGFANWMSRDNYRYALFGGDSEEATNGWNYKFKNIELVNSPPRFLYCNSKVSIGGKTNISALHDCMTLGSVEFENGTDGNFSMSSTVLSSGFYYKNPDTVGEVATGSEHEFRLKNTAKVKITSLGDVITPAAEGMKYLIEENAELTALSGAEKPAGIAIPRSTISIPKDSEFIARRGSIVYLKSYSSSSSLSAAAVYLNGRNAKCEIQEGATFKAETGNKDAENKGDGHGAISFGADTDETTEFILNRPLYYNIINGDLNGIWLQKMTDASVVRINDVSDMDYWHQGSPVKGAPNGMFTEIPDNEITGTELGYKDSHNLKINYPNSPWSEQAMEEEYDKALTGYATGASGSVKDVGTASKISSVVEDGDLMLFAPSILDFGSVRYLDDKGLVVAPKSLEDDPLLVKDTRKVKHGWKLEVKISKQLQNSKGEYIDNAFSYYDTSGKSNRLSVDSKLQIDKDKISDQYKNISSNWYKSDTSLTGIYLDCEKGLKISKGIYTGALEWTLEDTP